MPFSITEVVDFGVTLEREKLTTEDAKYILKNISLIFSKLNSKFHTNRKTLIGKKCIPYFSTENVLMLK